MTVLGLHYCRVATHRRAFVETFDERSSLIGKDLEGKGLEGKGSDRRATERRALDEHAQLILEFLNHEAGRNYQATEINLRFIRARLSAGATVDQCRAIIGRKTATWKGDPKMNQFLRPATLFNEEKFAQYLGELPATAFRRTPMPECPDCSHVFKGATCKVCGWRVPAEIPPRAPAHPLRLRGLAAGVRPLREHGGYPATSRLSARLPDLPGPARMGGWL